MSKLSGKNGSRVIILNNKPESLEIYLNEISKTPILSKEEETELVMKYQTLGCQESRNRLITSNLKFVVSIAKESMNRGLSVNDLINEGNIGLIDAVEDFDLKSGNRLISYAVWRIKQRINASIVKKAQLIRIPSNKYEGLQKVNKIISRLEMKLGRRPTEREILEEDDAKNIKYGKKTLTEEDIIDILGSARSEVSLDSPLDDGTDDNFTLSDIIATEEDNSIEIQKINKEISILLEDLTHQERNVIILAFGLFDCEEKLDLQQIGDIYSISKERVRQIKEKAIRKLRDNPETSKLFMYF